MNKEIENGNVIRMFMLMTHYRNPINLTDDRLKEARKIFNRFVARATPSTIPVPQEIIKCLENDLNTPGVIAIMHKYRKSGEGEKLYASLKFLGFSI